MSKFAAGVKNFYSTHKIWSSVIVVAILIAGYYEYKSLTTVAGVTKYALAPVEKSTIISSITGSGQVTASNQIGLKPKASGDIVYIGVKNGQQVSAGTLIAELDTTDAEKTVRDAESALQSAEIALQKLVGPNGLAVPRNKQQALDDLAKSYDNGFNEVSSAFLDLSTVMTGLQNILYGTNVVKGQDNISSYGDLIKNYTDSALIFKDDAASKYQIARTKYDQNISDYKNSSRYSSTSAIEALINETYDTSKAISDAVKSSINLLQLDSDTLTKNNMPVPTLINTYIGNLNTYTSTSNGHLVNLLNIVSAIKSDKDAVSNSDLDVQSQQLALEQKQNALADAKTALNDYYVRAPFDGTVANLTVNKYDSASSGTAIATLVTAQKFAQISLNEIDAAKVAVGQKATLTFDAIDGLTIAGAVQEVDTIGTVSQGVVTYNVQIAFDTQDAKIKSGMSVNAAVIVEMKQDALVVPSGAVKNQGNINYVEELDSTLSANPAAQTSAGIASPSAPKQIAVQTGISNDTMTEITSGLKEGDLIIVKTIAPTTSATASAPSILSSLGGNRGAAGGTVRRIGG